MHYSYVLDHILYDVVLILNVIVYQLIHLEKVDSKIFIDFLNLHKISSIIIMEFEKDSAKLMPQVRDNLMGHHYL